MKAHVFLVVLLWCLIAARQDESAMLQLKPSLHHEEEPRHHEEEPSETARNAPPPMEEEFFETASDAPPPVEEGLFETASDTPPSMREVEEKIFQAILELYEAEDDPPMEEDHGDAPENPETTDNTTQALTQTVDEKWRWRLPNDADVGNGYSKSGYSASGFAGKSSWYAANQREKAKRKQLSLDIASIAQEAMRRILELQNPPRPVAGVARRRDYNVVANDCWRQEEKVVWTDRDNGHHYCQRCKEGEDSNYPCRHASYLRRRRGSLNCPAPIGHPSCLPGTVPSPNAYASGSCCPTMTTTEAPYDPFDRKDHVLKYK